MALRVVSNSLRLPKKTFQIIDTLAYHAKSLYNVGLYNVRQHSATHRENHAILQGIRPDLTSGVEVLVGSYLPYTRKKDSPFKEYSTYVQSKENENYGLLHSDAAQQTLKSVEEAYIVTGPTSLKHTLESRISPPISPNRFFSLPVSQMPL